jgi:hypothetical protein
MFGAMTTTPRHRSQFSLCEGGRFHAVLVRAGLAGGARGRIHLVALLLITGWLPVVVLAALDGTVVGGVAYPLVRDIGLWVRFFVIVPVVVLVEPFADRGLGLAVEQFRRSGLIPAEHGVAFEREVEQAQRSATSDTVELIIIAIALALPHVTQVTAPAWMSDHAAWFGHGDGTGGIDPNAAGRWMLWFSLPLVEFLLLRWLWRILVWWRFLWRTARLPLDLAPSHPDRAGGLGFLASAPQAFVPVFAAVSALAASSIAAQISIGGRHLVEVRGAIAAFLVLEVLLLVVPQFFFVSVLSRVKRRALRQFEAAGSAMARAFEDRWTGPQAEGSEAMLESGGPGAMADFASTYERVAAMRPVSLSLREFVGIAAPLAVPFAPLLLYEFSLKEILTTVVGLLR